MSEEYLKKSEVVGLIERKRDLAKLAGMNELWEAQGVEPGDRRTEMEHRADNFRYRYESLCALLEQVERLPKIVTLDEPMEKTVSVYLLQGILGRVEGIIEDRKQGIEIGPMLKQVMSDLRRAIE